tara:strand:+ start:876 stop:1130 length:255 start_codon:yes stop_codon:yes gene_type:complete
VFVLGLFQIGRELELFGFGVLLLLLLLLLVHRIITGLVLTTRGLFGLLLILLLMPLLLLFGKNVRLSDVLPSETKKDLDLLELE